LLAPAVREIIIKGASPWANDRLAVVGDYAESFPIGIQHIPKTSIVPRQLCSIWRSNISSQDVELLYRLLGYQESSQAAEIVLRNLDKQQYVWNSALADSNLGKYSLGEIICIQTLFTDDSSGTEGLELKGNWVANRFDIATIEEIDDNWTDVSKDAIEMLSMVIGKDPWDTCWNLHSRKRTAGCTSVQYNYEEHYEGSKRQKV
jgi:hypothetical protein